MIANLLSWIIAPVGLVAFWLCVKHPFGWLIGVAQQGLFITYAIVSHLYGFGVWAVVFAAVFIRAYLIDKKGKKKKAMDNEEGKTVTETTQDTLILIDNRCGHPRCDEKNAYRMRGHCTNCGARNLLGLFSAGHEVSQGVLCKGRCPTCGNQTCYWDRLATPDETPGMSTTMTGI